LVNSLLADSENLVHNPIVRRFLAYVNTCLQNNRTRGTISYVKPSKRGSNGGKARAKNLTKVELVEIARAGGVARAAKLSPAKRRRIARMAGRAKGQVSAAPIPPSNLPGAAPK
jgi:hypothetical protein